MAIRSLARVFVPAGVVAILALGAVSIASASPADVTDFRECFPDGENTICYSAHSVEKLSDPTDDYSEPSREVGSFAMEYFDADGNLLWSSKTRSNTFTLEKDGETQVYHDQTRASYTEYGETCTAVHNATYANGETRHLGPEWQWVCK